MLAKTMLFLNKELRQEMWGMTSCWSRRRQTLLPCFYPLQWCWHICSSHHLPTDWKLLSSVWLLKVDTGPKIWVVPVPLKKSWMLSLHGWTDTTCFYWLSTRETVYPVIFILIFIYGVRYSCLQVPLVKSEPKFLFSCFTFCNNYTHVWDIRGQLRVVFMEGHVIWAISRNSAFQNFATCLPNIF